MTGYPVRTMGSSMAAAMLAMESAMVNTGRIVAEMTAKLKAAEVADRPPRFDSVPTRRFHHGGNCDRRRKTNRLHLSKKAKVKRRRAK